MTQKPIDEIIESEAEAKTQSFWVLLLRNEDKNETNTK